MYVAVAAGLHLAGALWNVSDAVLFPTSVSIACCWSWSVTAGSDLEFAFSISLFHWSCRVSPAPGNTMSVLFWLFSKLSLLVPCSFLVVQMHLVTFNQHFLCGRWNLPKWLLEHIVVLRAWNCFINLLCISFGQKSVWAGAEQTPEPRSRPTGQTQPTYWAPAINWRVKNKQDSYWLTLSSV